MVVRPAGNDADASVHQAAAERLGIVQDVLLINTEIVAQRFLKADRLRRDHMHQRAALGAGEDRLVEVPLLRGFLIAEDHAASGPAQGLVGGGGHHVRVGNRAGMKPRSHQAGDMGHIHHQAGSHLVGDLAERLEIYGPRIGGRAGDDHLRAALPCGFLHLVIIQEPFVVHAVGNHVKIFSGHVHRASVRQVAAVVQVHSHDGVSGREHGKLHRHVGLGAGMGLHVGIITAEQLLRAFNGKVFHLIHIIAAAVVAFSRVALRIFVGEYASHGGHHRFAHPVLRCDQLDMAVLTLLLVHDRLCDLRIRLSHFIQ